MKYVPISIDMLGGYILKGCVCFLPLAMGGGGAQQVLPCLKGYGVQNVLDPQLSYSVAPPPPCN